MKLKQLLKILNCENITICYAGFGERLYKGKVKDFNIEHYFEFYITYLQPSYNDSIYVEIHENKNFLEN